MVMMVSILLLVDKKSHLLTELEPEHSLELPSVYY